MAGAAVDGDRDRFLQQIFLQESWNKKTERFLRALQGKAWLDILKKRIE